MSSRIDRVEGASEIDITLEGRNYLIYIEAKLHSDISTGTTHDAERDQISRNIDCLLEHCGERRPFFWMLVRDDGPGWLYAQRVDVLRKGACEFLPHRPQETTGRIAKGIVLLLWRDVLEIATRNQSQDELTASVITQLRRRFGLIPNLPRSPDRTAAVPLEHRSDRREVMENVSVETVTDAISLPHEAPTVAEPSLPSIRGKECACGCGLPVKKYDYVWGHRSRSRINTIPMGAKDVRISGAVGIEETPMHFAIKHMHEQISQFEQKIDKLKETIDMLQKLIDNEE